MRRKNSLRKYGYDYNSDGWYFVTIVVKDRQSFFGDINNYQITLNKYGEIVKECWEELPSHYANCIIDEFIIMPNHFHGIINIHNNPVGAGLKPAPTDKQHGLSEMIRAFKTFSSRRINDESVNKKFQWQRSFHDRIIRSEREYTNIKNYIFNNPLY